MEPKVIASDLAPYSLIGSAMEGLLQRVDLLGPAAQSGGYELALSGDAPPAVAWQNLSGFKATFAGNIQVQQGDVTVWTSGGGTLSPTGFTRAYDAATDTTTATWTVPGLTPELPGLGGEWFDLSFHNSIHRPGHGVIGGDFSLAFSVTPGDLSGDGLVDAADLTIFNTEYALNVGQQAAFARTDLNLDGITNAADQDVFDAYYQAAAQRPDFDALMQHPSAPYDLKATPTGQNSIRLTWQNASNEPIVIQRQDAGMTAWTTVATRPAGSTSYENTGLTAGRAFTYRVGVFNGDRNVFSAPAMASATSGALESSFLVGLLRRVELLPAEGVTAGGFDGYVLGMGAGNTVAWANVQRVAATFIGRMDVKKEDLSVHGRTIADHAVTAFSSTYDAAADMTRAVWVVPTLDPRVSGNRGERVALQFHNSIRPVGGQALAGPDFTLRFNMLAGDVNHNNQANSADGTTFTANFSSGSPVGSFHIADLNLNGFLDADDQTLFTAWTSTQTSLPAGATVVAASAPWSPTVTVRSGRVNLTWLEEWTSGQILVQRAPGNAPTEGDFVTVATLASTGGQGSYEAPDLLEGTSYTYRLIKTVTGGKPSRPSVTVGANLAVALSQSALAGLLTQVQVLRAPGDTTGYTLPIGTGANRTLPWTGLGAIRAVFAGRVQVLQDDLHIAGVDTPVYPVTAFTAAYDPVTDRTTATWTVPALGGTDKSDRLILQFHNSIFALGEAPRPGGDFSLPVRILAGDVTGDGLLSAADASAYAAANASGSPAPYAFADVDLDGALTATDAGAANGSLTLPAGTPEQMLIAPESPSVHSSTPSSIRLTWPKGSPLRAVRVERSLNPAGPFVEVGQVDEPTYGAPYFTDVDVTPGTPYAYRLVTVDVGDRASHPSGVTVATTASSELNFSALAGLIKTVSLLPSDGRPFVVPLGVGTDTTPVIPWTGFSTVVVSFNGAIAVDKEDLTILGAAQAVHPAAAFRRQYNPVNNTTTATWEVPSLDPSVSGHAVEHVALQFHNAITAIGGSGPQPARGEDFVMSFNVVVGDLTGDGTVGADDVSAYAAAGGTGTVVPYLSRADLDVDGQLSAGDAAEVAGASGRTALALPVRLLSAPSALRARAAGTSAITLTWALPAANVPVRVERAPGPQGAFVQVGVVPAGADTFTDAGLQAGTAYAYRLVAVGGAGDSRPSAAAGASTGTPALAPTALKDLLQDVELVTAPAVGYTLGLATPAPEVVPWTGFTAVRARFKGDVYVDATSLGVHGAAQMTYAVTGVSKVYDEALDESVVTWAVPSLSGVTAEKLALQFHSTIASVATGLMPGWDFILYANLLAGDLDGSGTVTVTDASAVGAAATADAVPLFTRADVTMDGAVTAADVTAAVVGRTLPSGVPALDAQAPTMLHAALTPAGDVALTWTADVNCRSLVQVSISPDAPFQTIANLDPGVATFTDPGLRRSPLPIYRVLSVGATEVASGPSPSAIVDLQAAMGGIL